MLPHAPPLRVGSDPCATSPWLRWIGADFGAEGWVGGGCERTGAVECGSEGSLDWSGLGRRRELEWSGADWIEPTLAQSNIPRLRSGDFCSAAWPAKVQQPLRCKCLRLVPQCRRRLRKPNREKNLRNLKKVQKML